MGESYRKQNLFLTFYSIRVKCEELFVNLIQTLKINKNIIVKLCTSILIEIFNKNKVENTITFVSVFGNK